MSKIQNWDLVKLSESYFKDKSRCGEDSDRGLVLVVTGNDLVTYGPDYPMIARVLIRKGGKINIGCLYAKMKESDFIKLNQKLSAGEKSEICEILLKL